MDPLMLGRLKVRVLGYHTDDKNLIPTEDLPWAYPSQPITSAAISGVGHTPMGPVEGTWVFGFFRDGESCQEPVVIGTFGGIPEAGANPVLGFNDPKGRFPLLSEFEQVWPLPNSPEALAGAVQPKLVGKPDTNSLGRGHGGSTPGPKNGEQHTSLVSKRASRMEDVPTGKAGKMKAIDGSGALYASAPWNEPNPRYGGTEEEEYNDPVSSAYPHNHVRQSECGHVEEWDDTPGSERLHKYHTSGTFEEIQSDGTRIVKNVGNSYEMTEGVKNIVIGGTCNVTIGADCRMLFKGNLIQEVEGDYHLYVKGDHRTKVKGNQVTEVMNNRKTVINIKDDLFVGGEQVVNVASNQTLTTGGKQSIKVGKDAKHDYIMGLSQTVNLPWVMNGVTTVDISAIGNLGLSANLNVDISSGINMNITSGINMDITSMFNMDINNSTFTHITMGISSTYNAMMFCTTLSLNKISALPILLN
jgi:hypothetical protein